MSTSKIIILRDTLRKPEPSPDSIVLAFQELKRRILQGEILKLLFRYQEAQLLTYRIGLMNKPFNTALLLRLLGWGRCYFEDEQGRRQDITLRELARLFRKLLRDFRRKPALLRRVSYKVERLPDEQAARHSTSDLDLSATPVYLRTDLCFGVRSGGSIGHIAGVLNHLDDFTGKPVLLTTDTIPTVRNDLEIHLISPGEEFWDFRELPSFFFNEVFERRAHRLLNGRNLSFIYQRYSLNNYAGLKLARFYGIPFVLEYNGSEIWINRHWGSPLKYESLSERIELLNLRAADLVVVVSQPMKDELAARDIKADKILVNPNGVDPERYSPDADGSEIRRQYDLNGKTVVGFIGTFGPWHGAEELAWVAAMLCRDGNPHDLHFLFIGDGMKRIETESIIQEAGIAQHSTFSGLIPQEAGPEYLAACDILVAPHVPNPDGTPFFGSPTKLFEYMAMAKGIVASNLDQIGEVLEDRKTAVLVRPGDPDDLAQGILYLVEHPQEANRLGENARREVINNYTWKQNVKRVIQALEQIQRFGKIREA